VPERPGGARRTIVFFHAHPDDEALLTAGSMAACSGAGHRVVLVTATAGEQGLAPGGTAGLAARRTVELQAAADAVGCARLVLLGYADSGMDGAAAGPDGFAHAEVEPVAQRLAALLREEGATALTVYDPAGGYGHPDHRQVHRVGVRAAELAGTPLVLEATVDRAALLAASSWLPRLPGGQRRRDLSRAFVERRAITHRVDVRRQSAAKRAALAAHRSQTRPGLRTLRLLLALPEPVFVRALGHEWYVERGRPAGGPLVTDLVAALEAAG
jgi:LmbE family N-acetylglucosaminyl deacetylase